MNPAEAFRIVRDILQGKREVREGVTITSSGDVEMRLVTTGDVVRLFFTNDQPVLHYGKWNLSVDSVLFTEDRMQLDIKNVPGFVERGLATIYWRELVK